MAAVPEQQLTAKDYATDQDVRWCPGCGDYSILSQMKKVMSNLQMSRENTVFVSGIGCSSRFPYYMNTYGFHSIHGRAPAVATGLKIANPDLNVFVITGDGDGFSIGGNHMIHAIRRNLNITILLFNNRIYGLTKGQASPTSEYGKITKSTPLGLMDAPLNPISVVLGAGATFVARSVDVHVKHLQEILQRAIEHEGTSFVEIYQNCNIFNDGAWEWATDRKSKEENIIDLQHGKPLVFGKEQDKGIRMNKNFEVEVVTLGENGVTEDDLLVHDEYNKSSAYAQILAELRNPDYPEPMGVLRQLKGKPTYDKAVYDQVRGAMNNNGSNDLESLIYSGDLWEVKE